MVGGEPLSCRPHLVLGVMCRCREWRGMFSCVHSSNQSRALFTTASLVRLRSLRRVDKMPHSGPWEAVSSVDPVALPPLPLRPPGSACISDNTGSRLGSVAFFCSGGIELCSVMNRAIQLSKAKGSDMEFRQKSSKVLRRATCESD